jgi:transcriptional regulator with GAF, ATPase, and Fis domain
MKPRIVILSGSQAGREYLILAAGLTVGRAADNDVCIDDPLASRHHFSLRSENGHVVLHDGQTPNGTFVDGVARIEYVTRGGERIQCGGTSILYLQSEDSPESLLTIIDDEADRNRNLVTLRLDETVHDRGTVFFQNAADVLRKLPRAMNAGFDVDELQARILDFAFDLIPAYRGAILVNGPRVSPDPADFKSRICRDRDFDGPISFPMSRKVLDEVYAKRKPYLSNDVPPILCVPLIVLGRVCGALYLEGKQQSGGFEEEHLSFLEALSDNAALALVLSRQFDSIGNELDLVKAARTFKVEIVGESDAIQRVKQQMKKAAADDTASVLIMGETGTGKEGVARGIHEMSRRRDKPLVAFNCGNAFEPSLVQSQLFGHVKGGFTGAIEARKGKLLEAHGGTIFFDEMGDFPGPLQSLLLRVLQEREFEHVGSDKPIKVDVRVIAATKVDLEEAVRNKTFREDLFYRLNVVTIIVPPLRERRDDIPLLAEHFLRKYGAHRPRISIAPEVMDTLISYHWPGNIRELETAIHRAIVDANSDVITLENIPDRVRNRRPAPANSPSSLDEIGRRARREALLKEIEADLAKNGNNVRETARRFDVSESYIYRLLRQSN